MIAYLVPVLAFLVFGQAVADTPANCTYDDIQGAWIFSEGERSSDSGIDCKNFKGPEVYRFKLKLSFPNVATDELGNKGYWTIIYNQGFEVTINYRKYFAFSKYEENQGNVTSYCDTVLPGWSHDVLGKNWACYNAQRADSLHQKPKVHYVKRLLEETQHYRVDKSFVRQINKFQKSWTATVYPQLDGMPMGDLIRRSGGHKSKIHSIPPPLPKTRYHEKLAERLPEEFDWRNVNGVNYVSPVRNQGSCGSCFAFSSMAMIESRLRIATNNTLQLTLSPQDVVSCSEYSQGCEGGFPYLIAGKYAQDFGVVPEKCNPYRGKDDSCSEKKCKRFYVAGYKYVGGFYGGCNEELMKFELVQNGPIAVGFEVYPDFQTYSGGVYHHTGLTERFNPFELTNHAVLVVGYGVDEETKEKHWIVKNSWGEGWGEDGFFRIRRGTDECGIESLAVAAIPIPCNEELMKLELVQNGPMAVSFEVYPDFQQYRGGIYQHTGLRDRFNPFEITNHAVLAVGYGADEGTGEKFWIVKNSWGEGWGENGFFRIRRGTDECSIESIAVAATPIP